LTEPGMLFSGLGFQPWQPPARIGQVAADGAAASGGLQVGDHVVAIDGEAVVTFGDLQRVVAERPEKTVPITYLRDGAEQTVTLTLGARDVEGVRQGWLGVGIENPGDSYWYLRKYGAFKAVLEAGAQTWASTAFTVNMLGRMVTGEVSMKNISGPINIAQYAGDSAQAGMNSFLRFLALVSISLGVLNLLPIPVLDGGQIVFQTAEWIKGSPLSERSQIIGQQFGILALLLLMTFAFYNDITRILE
ncbi:MAG: RIP metalloprotease RseP, partial [Woeseia sp.]